MHFMYCMSNIFNRGPPTPMIAIQLIMIINVFAKLLLLTKSQQLTEFFPQLSSTILYYIVFLLRHSLDHR